MEARLKSSPNAVKSESNEFSRKESPCDWVSRKALSTKFMKGEMPCKANVGKATRSIETTNQTSHFQSSSSRKANTSTAGEALKWTAKAMVKADKNGRSRYKRI